jgi:two-component system, NtrC family, response regulator HydG
MKRRILVVDDDQDHAESVADLLTLHGHEVDMAYSGEEAVRRSAQWAYDLALLDVKLPGMNGVEALLAIRKERKDAHVIMMTGFSVDELLTQALENGARGVLHKPLALPELLKAIRGIAAPEKAA